MYPSHQLSISGPTTRKVRPLPPRPSEHSRDYAGIHYRTRTSDISSLSSTSTHPPRRSNSAPTKAVSKVVDAHTLSESENILGHTTPPNGITISSRISGGHSSDKSGAITKQTIFHDQWKRLDFIGKGSYGQVYRALDITTGTIFAVKEVNSKIKRNTLVQALQDERETLKELKHPNIVHYLGFEEKQGVLNIFLEYVPGGTIRSCLNTHGKFKEEVTKSFASQILHGLSYLHSKSILHRDLKSENILVEARGICKISDFGISKKALETDRGRLYSNLKGTIAYMAPEMIDNKKEGYDCKIDIWSVGCIMFEMWTGKTPWSGKQDVQILMKLFTEKLAPPLPDDISLTTTAESFRQECFHIDPEKRSSAVKLLQHPYLELPSQWTFPGVAEIGQLSNTSSKSIAHRHSNPPHNDLGTETDHSIQDQEDSLRETIYSDLEAIATKIRFFTTSRSRRSPSLARTMYSDVIDPRSRSPPLMPLTPLGPRKKPNLSNTSLKISSQKPPLNASRRLKMHNADPDDTEDARKLDDSERRPYVYQPPLPDINISSPYSRTLVPPISIRFSKPIGQAFSKPNLGKPAPAKPHGRISTNSPTDISSVSISLACPDLRKVDYSVGQRGASYRLAESDDDDDDECYSPSAWKRPPVDIPIRLFRVAKPAKTVESVSDWNIHPTHRHHRPLPSAIPRPSVETVYKGFLSDNIENMDLPDTRVARSSISSKRRNTIRNIREIVEERLYQAQISPAQSPQRAHFWNSHMQEIKS